MSAPIPFPAPPRTGAWPMYRAMVGVGLVCGLLIVTAFEGTKPVIERNRAAALERAIFRVLPEARSRRTYRLLADDRFEPATGATAAGVPEIHAGFDASGRLVGFAIEASGMGYQDVVRVLYGYSSERDAIVGLQILESRETPGLGDKIGNDAAFLANFERLDVSLAENGSALAHAIVAVKHGEKEHAWQVDGITGATISSKAVASILDGSATFWAPRLERNLDGFGAE